MAGSDECKCANSIPTGKDINYIIKNETNLVTILHNVQEVHNYLPKEVLEDLSKNLNIPLSHIYRLATFYKAFSLKPKGSYHIKVCKGTACHVREARRIIDRFETMLNIKTGETTKDKKFSLETVNCLGVCALGPVVVLNGEYFGEMTQKKVEKLLKEYFEK